MGKDAATRVHLIEDGNLGADITSRPFNIARLSRAMILLSSSGGGSPNGTFSVQASVDYRPNMDGSQGSSGTWVDLDLSSSPALSGSDDDIIIDITETGAPWIRVFYDRTSGTGTLQAWLSAKAS